MILKSVYIFTITQVGTISVVQNKANFENGQEQATFVMLQGEKRSYRPFTNDGKSKRTQSEQPEEIIINLPV